MLCNRFNQTFLKYSCFLQTLDRDLLCSIRAYISTHGIDLYRYPSTDIVQSILQHESTGILYTKAWDLARQSVAKKELYFEFLHEQDVEEIKHSTIDVKENISAVCFLGDYVLVGTFAGLVKFFHIPTNKLKKELNGSEYGIKWIGACPMNPPQVAALSFDGVIKMWFIDDVEREETDDVIDEVVARDVAALQRKRDVGTGSAAVRRATYQRHLLSDACY
ncbi:uncharacterized protein LOC114360012 [Ostrinia furnacalis]|uniref:uncharacterized protein LOC114360012 n=1 Tax=Ostrinia furnacalis TaxID=93504 RepID=UPI00103B544D|nr:uncharacterized protein LOC114360012 [Ostrinia furnacalis]